MPDTINIKHLDDNEFLDMEGCEPLLNNTEQINQALDDMCNVFSNLPIEAQELFAQSMYQHMSEINNTSYYTFHVFKGFYQRALEYGVNIKNSEILEIGAGKPLGTGIFWNFSGARRYTSIDKFTQLNVDDLWLNRFKSILNMNLFNPQDLDIDSLVRKEGDQYILNYDKIRLIQDSLEDHTLNGESFDFIYSNAVLEHMDNIEAKLKKMHNMLKDDGVMYHGIDLREHHTNLRKVPDKNTSIDFLKFSKEEWEGMYPPGSEFYINRLRASDLQKYFKDSGFRITDFIVTQEMDLDEAVYSKIHPEFSKYSIDDLKITGISVVLKKA